MSQDLLELTYIVLKDAKIATRKKPDVKFFQVHGDEPFHAGSLNMNWGGIVGLPHNFNYKKVNEINTSEIKVFADQRVKWDTKPGKRLLESMVLSEKAQKFATAREIYYLNNNHVLFQSSAVAVSAVLGVAIAEFVLKMPKYKIAEKPTVVRLVLYGLCFCIGYFNWCMLHDGLNNYYDRDSDKQAALTGEDYFDGGVEYYSQMLKRNKAFRKLLGDKGARFITSEGDTRTFWRCRHMPTTVRLHAINDLKNPDREQYR